MIEAIKVQTKNKIATELTVKRVMKIREKVVLRKNQS